jgi:hypothetical protein
MREKCKRHHLGMATLYRLVSGLTCAAAAAAGLASCASSPVGHGVAADEFHRLGPGGKKVANEFYSYGVSDETKNLYWAQRRMQEPAYDDQRPALQRKYVTVWMPEQKQPDGTITEGHYKVVEVVD